MGKCRRMLRCYHCGAVLQDSNPKVSGYISNTKIKDLNATNVLYCDRCYEVMKSFNNSALDLQIDEDILRVLDDAIATDAIILWAIDLFAFNGALNPEIARKVSKLKVVVIGNKLDLMPFGTKKDNLEAYVKERFQEYGIDPIAVRLLGNFNKVDYDNLLSEMNEARRGHDVYLIGNSYSGKTTLINRMLKNYENKTNRVIRTVTYGDTNTKVLEIPLSRSSFLYELPGFSQRTSVDRKVEKEVTKFIIPHKQIKVSTKTLLANDAIAIGSLGGFALMSGKLTSVKFYSAEGVETKKMNVNKLESFFTENFQKRTIRPVSDRYSSYLDFDVFEYTMEKDNQLHDIAIEGLCWISFKAQGQIIRVIAPKGASIKECLSKIR